MSNFLGSANAAYNRPNNKLMLGGKNRRKPFASERTRVALKELANKAILMTEATTEAAYHLRKTQLIQLLRQAGL